MQQKIINTARGWIGTPFHLHGRMKQIGCDCLGLVIGVSGELGLKDVNGKDLTLLDSQNYSLSYQGRTIAQMLKFHLKQPNFMHASNLALMEFDSNPNHMAIVSELEQGVLSIIHSSISCRQVVEQRLDEHLLSKIKQLYQLVS